MRICIEAQRLFRNHKHGMEIVALETIRALQEIDKVNEYHIITAEDEDTTSLVSENNFIVHRLPAGFYPKWEQLSLPSFVKKLNPDLLHCTANTAPLFYKGKMLVTIHDLIFMDKTDSQGSAYQKFGNYYRKLIVPKVAKKATKIATVSKFSKQEIVQRLGIDEDKVRVIYNGVSEIFQLITNETLKQNIAAKYKLPHQFILHIGNTAPRKNTVNVLKAYEIFLSKNIAAQPLVILGCKADFIQSLLHQNNLNIPAEKMLIPGYIASQDLPVIYNLTSLFLYPSLSEGFGLPVLEAMACGAPVLTSNNSSLNEVSGQAAKLVNPKNVEEIAAAIQQVIENEELKQYMKSQGIMNALRFSWRMSAEETLAVYNEIANL